MPLAGDYADMQQNLLLVAILALTAGVIALLLPVWLRHRTRHLIARADDLQVIRSTAVQLVDDDTVPEIMIRIIAMMVEAAKSPKLAHMFFKALVTGEFARPAADTGRRAAVARAVESMSVEQLRLFACLYEHVLLSSASCDPIFAAAGRRFLIWGLRSMPQRDVVEPAKTKTEAPIMADIMERYQPREHLHRDLVAA